MFKSKNKKLPKEKIYENYTFNQATDYLKQVIQLLDDKTEKLPIAKEDKDLNDLLERVSIAYFVYQKFIEDIGNFIAESQYINCIAKLINENNVELYFAYNAIINFSATSLVFGKRVSESTLLPFFIKKFLESGLKDFKLISENLNIIHNVAIDLDNKIENKEELINKLKDIIERDADSEEFRKKNRILALLTLTYLIAGKEHSSIITLEDTVRGSVKELIKMINSVNQVDFRYLGFSIPCMLIGLKCLCATSNLTNEFCNNAGLKMLNDRLDKSEVPDEELESILEIILQLSLNRHDDKLKENNINISSLMKRFENNKNGVIQKHLNSLHMATLDDSQKQVVKYTSKIRYKFDIFLSYCHSNKNRVLELKRLLESQNWKIWFDDEKMSGCTIDCMANGIEQSRFVMICISQAYKASGNCKSEACYSHNCEKDLIPVKLEYKYKPDGWLGFVITSLMYYELTEKKDTTKTMIVNINKKMTNVDENENDEKQPIKQIEHKPNTQSPVNVILNEVDTISSSKEFKDAITKIKLWTEKDVENWLKENHISGIFGDDQLDGCSFVELINDWAINEAKFKQTIKDDYKITIVKVSKFISSLKKLLNCD